MTEPQVPEALKTLDVYALLGKKQSDPELNVLTQLDGAETKEFSDCTYINFKKYGISFMLAKPKNGEKYLDSIFLYNAGNRQKFEKYLGNLPHDISMDLNNVEIVKKFGEPEGKPKPSVGGIVSIYVDYQKLGMQIDFKHTTYEHMNNPIDSICFYQPNKK